ncbi:MAG: BRO family protein [Parvibaculaceae bacterium]|nr:BRO family protein [Parvibaculaceae bacterium]
MIDTQNKVAGGSLSHIVPFEFEDFTIRVMEVAGEPWFVAKDIARALGYAKERNAVQIHCKRATPAANLLDAVKPYSETQDIGGPQFRAPPKYLPLGLDPQTVLIPESDMYRMIFRSNLPSAKRFEEKVVSEILPAIRKTGAYISPAATGVTFSAEDRKVMGGIVKSIIHKELGEVMPSMVQAVLSERSYSLRSGRTAGQIWKDFNLPVLKGAAVWFGNRLDEMGCCIQNKAKGELGLTSARLFDPDKVRICMKNGLLEKAKSYVDERYGQGKLRLVSSGEVKV